MLSKATRAISNAMTPETLGSTHKQVFDDYTKKLDEMQSFFNEQFLKHIDVKLPVRKEKPASQKPMESAAKKEDVKITVDQKDKKDVKSENVKEKPKAKAQLYTRYLNSEELEAAFEKARESAEQESEKFKQFIEKTRKEWARRKEAHQEKMFRKEVMAESCQLGLRIIKGAKVELNRMASILSYDLDEKVANKQMDNLAKFMKVQVEELNKLQNSLPRSVSVATQTSASFFGAKPVATPTRVVITVEAAPTTALKR